MNKKLISVFSCFCLILLVSPVFAAIEIENPLAQGGVRSFGDLLKKIMSTLSDPLLISALGTLMVMIAGFIFLVSMGNPGLVGKAKQALFMAALGMVLIMGNSIIIGFANRATNAGGPIGFVNTIMMEIFNIIAGVSTIMIIISGLVFLSASANPEKIKTAKTILIYAITGLVVSLIATPAVTMVMGWFS